MAPLKIGSNSMSAQGLARGGQFERLWKIAFTITRGTSQASVDEFKNFLSEARSVWEQSDCRQALLASLKQHAPPKGWQIKRNILFGLGNITNFELDIGIPEALRIVMQLVVFLDIASIASVPSDQPLELIAQEPLFTPSDKAALEHLGFRIVEQPVAESLVNAESFTMAPFTNFDQDIMCIALEDRPKLHIGLPEPVIVRNTACDIALCEEAYRKAVKTSERNPKFAEDHLMLAKIYHKSAKQVHENWDIFPFCNQPCKFLDDRYVRRARVFLNSFVVYVRKVEQISPLGPGDMSTFENCDKCLANTIDLGHGLKRCANCKVTEYCGEECQKADWQHHKKICKYLGAAKEMDTKE